MDKKYCWDGECGEGIALCCKWCDRKETCGDPCDDTKCMEEKSMSEKMRWLYIGNRVIDGKVLEVYRCSKCCCLITVERGAARPNECTNCGAGVFVEEATTKVEWIPTSVAKPRESGKYLCYRPETDSVLYLDYSVTHDAFNCFDDDKNPQHIMEVAYWGPKVEKPRKRMEEV